MIYEDAVVIKVNLGLASCIGRETQDSDECVCHRKLYARLLICPQLPIKYME